jgi:hypothetical protein
MKAMKQKLYRQGDVLFCAIDKLPAGKTAKRENGVVAYGEVTGHKHALADLNAAEVLEIDDGLFVRVSDEGLAIDADTGGQTGGPYGGARRLIERTVRGATFVHEEHGPITLPPGDYRVQIQREYTPEEIRNVVD